MTDVHPYRWHILLTLGFFLVITLVFFIVGSGSQPKVNVQTTNTEPTTVTSPSISVINPMLGPKDAPVTLVLYADFSGSSSRELATNLNAVMTQFPNDVRLVWKDFPNESASDQATPAAIAARCAGDQGMFWQYYESLYSHQGSLNDAAYTTIAQSLGLQMKSFQNCYQNRDPLPRIRKDYEEGLALKLTATPTIFINNERLVGAISRQELENTIKAALSSK